MITVSTLTSSIAELLPEPQAGLLSGLLFGTKEALTPEFKQALITTGTLHIVALSGMNITIMAGLIGAILLPLVGRRWASAITIAAIIVFISFVGPAPSIIRAAIMGGLSLVAVILGKPSWALFSLGLAIAVMLLVNFSWIGDLSFQLSVLSTAGIILFGPSANKKLEAGAGKLAQVSLRHPAARVSDFTSVVWSSIKDDVHLTLSAQVFTVPLIFFNFHRVSLISPLPNVLIGPILAPVTIVGWATIAATFIFWPLAQVLSWVTWVPLTYLIWIVQTSSVLPFASWSF